jgi:hypothetical protein
MVRLVALVGFVVGLGLAAPLAWLTLYEHQHPGDAAIGLEAAIFFALIAFFGLSIALRSLWRLIKGGDA